MALEANDNRDVFLSHSSLDKEAFVLPLARELESRGISYWLDEAEIKWGDKITQAIDQGLGQSRYVVVILSDNFLGRDWPEAELGSALNRETSDGQTIVLPLIVGNPETILAKYSLLRDKNYLHWDRGIPYIVDRLADLLRYTKAEPSAPEEPVTASSDEVPRDIQGTQDTGSQLLKTVVYFNHLKRADFDRLSPRVFAIVAQWVEFEDVKYDQSRGRSLEFPGGSFELSALDNIPCLMLLPGIIPLKQILTELGEQYSPIEFQTNESTDFGDLVRRSRAGVRNIELIAPEGDSVTFSLPNASAEINVENYEEGCSIFIAVEGGFKPDGPLISYAAVRRYLQSDPPSDELADAINDAAVIPTYFL